MVELIALVAAIALLSRWNELRRLVHNRGDEEMPDEADLGRTTATTGGRRSAEAGDPGFRSSWDQYLDEKNDRAA
ncbi:MAG: hypothetical protein VKL23_09485 [Cyanobacteriota bacterium]|jgi:hypothetical protein|nr:hypothetical protein [Cyanobacteriota bacterium]